MFQENHSLARSLFAGLAGATVLTAIHETVRRQVDDAPRMDTYGRRAIAKGIELTGHQLPSQDHLQQLALAGDIVSNAAYFAVFGVSRRKASLTRGAIAGAVAGVGAIVLGPMMNLGKSPSQKSNQTAAMTIAWYTIGGLASAAVYKLLDKTA